MILVFAFSVSSLAFGYHNPDVGTTEKIISADHEKTFAVTPVVACDFVITANSENCELVVADVNETIGFCSIDTSVKNSTVSNYSLYALPDRIHRKLNYFKSKHNVNKKSAGTIFADLPMKVGWKI